MIDLNNSRNLAVRRLACCLRLPLALPVLTAVLVLATPALVQAQFSYTVTNQMVTITGYTGTTDVASIPSTINGLPVTSIGDYAFAGSSIAGVTIPDSVTSVGDFAFSGCYSLTNITLGSGVTSIGVSAFSEYNGFSKYYVGCPLINVTIPNSVTNIGDAAFAGASLTNIMVDPLNSAYSSVDGVLFNQSQTTLVEYPGGKLGGYIIPSTVTSIGVSAFEECSGLTSVTIPNSVTSIGARAFLACHSLTSVNLGSGVTNIGDYAFEFCSNLTSIYFQGNAPTVGGTNVFLADNATIYYLPGTTGWGSTFAGFPTALWTLPYPLILTTNPSFGERTNQFGFTVSWATNLNVVVEASTDLKNPKWSPVTTNALNGGTFQFTDPQWKNYPARFYRIRSP